MYSLISNIAFIAQRVYEASLVDTYLSLFLFRRINLFSTVAVLSSFTLFVRFKKSCNSSESAISQNIILQKLGFT